MTGITAQALRENGGLRIAPSRRISFKKRADCTEDEVSPAAAIAEQVANALVKSVDVPDKPKANLSAADARRYILDKWPAPNLEALIDFAWDHGIIVAHLAELPAASKKFDGLAMFSGTRPIVVLASRRDSPAWLAFHVAHELGHILLGHVTSDSDSISDTGLESKSEDPEEIEANRFALELLTGNPDTTYGAVYGLTGQRLAVQAQRIGPEKSIDPGVLALVYGWSADRIPAAQNALNRMNQQSGAHQIISSGVRRHLKDDLPESLRMLINLVTES